MNIARINSARARTEQKLQYAIIHLDELRLHPFERYSAFEAAHQESYLFHLFGVRDAFLSELNEYYQCGLSTNEMSLGRLRKKLLDIGKKSEELKELYLLEKSENSWFSNAKEMRDQAMHVHSIPLSIHIGGPTDGQVRLKNPKTESETQVDYIDEFILWKDKMIELVLKLRKSAEMTCNIKL